MNTKVLIADDNKEIGHLVETFFDSIGGFNFIHAHSTSHAVEIAQDNPDINVVILDMDCLGMGGVVEVLRMLCPQCKILLYSGALVGDEDPGVWKVDAVCPKSSAHTLLVHKVSQLSVV